MPAEYAQTWRQLYEEQIQENVAIIDKPQTEQENLDSQTSWFKIAFNIMICFVIIIFFALLLSWLDNKIAYEKGIKHDDVPNYTQTADQEFLREFFVNGYVGQAEINLSLR